MLKTIPNNLFDNDQLHLYFVITNNIEEGTCIYTATKCPAIIIENTNDIKNFVEKVKPFYKDLYGGFEMCSFIFIRSYDDCSQSLLKLYQFIVNNMYTRYIVIEPQMFGKKYKNFIDMQREEKNKNTISRVFKIRLNGNIKDMFIPLLDSIVVNKDYYETEDVIDEYKALKSYQELLDEKIFNHYVSNTKFKEWIEVKDLFLQSGDKNYFEYDFVWIFYNLVDLNLFTLERIAESSAKNISNPDFIITNKITGNKTIIELTKFDLNIDFSKKQSIENFINLNQPALDIINTHNSTMLAEMYIPEWYATKLLGNGKILDKIDKKIKQLENYLTNVVETLENDTEKTYHKIIIMDISRLIADARVTNTNLFYLIKKSEDQKLVDVIQKLQKLLLEKNIILICSLESFSPLINNHGASRVMIMFTGDNVENIDRKYFVSKLWK